MKLIQWCLCLLFFFNVVACSKKGSPEAECFEYPEQIDSLGITDLYDTARWYLYTWLGDAKHTNRFNGEMDLNYKEFFLRNDSIELFFELFEPYHLAERKGDPHRISKCSFVFDLKIRKKLWGFDINGFSHSLDPGDERFENPHTPEVVTFIYLKKDILNPCFRELAKRLKVIE
jgi:hypothetical protein